MGLMSSYKASSNKKVLIVDGTNTFIRGMAVSKVINSRGVHIGGISGFLLSVGYAIKHIKPTKLIIVFDGQNGRVKRKALYPEYKANRDKVITKPRNDLFLSVDHEREAMDMQMKRLKEYFKILPLQFIVMNNCEADDVIAYVTRHKEFEKLDKYVMSTDSDFLQLIDDKTYIYSPLKKIIYNDKKLKELLQLNSENVILYKSILGDTSDNIKGVKGIGVKTLQSQIPILFEDKKITIEDIDDYIDTIDKPSKRVQSIKENLDIVELNSKIIQLDEPLMDQHQKILIDNDLKHKVPSLNKIKFLQYSKFDGILGNLKDPLKWLDDCFKLLNFQK